MIKSLLKYYKIDDKTVTGEENNKLLNNTKAANFCKLITLNKN